MNINFWRTDPFNPVHIMSFSGARENASQVHQLVSMRGLMSDPQGQMIDLPIQTHKVVVDTTVQTSDVGYLTRRLVEVVQHIVVHQIDCGTIRGISVITRVYDVLTLGIKILGLELPLLVAIHLRYSPTHGDLVELEEVDCIIVGQSIGEPGTQLTLRTFHIGGVFTGGISEHDLVHPTRTRDGHPVLLCYIDLYVTVENDDIIYNIITIAPKVFY
ncbi:hypothetical protein Lal_00033630 [Lupinus albus]|nr:hypothetical protein Lal_00033630 [Lupinus albus]